MTQLYKHVNNTDVAVEIIKKIPIPNKNYYKIKVRWWNISKLRQPYCMYIETWLQDASIKGNIREKRKYSKEKWINEWELYKFS